MEHPVQQRKRNRHDTAVSEVIGTLLLLGMAIALFSIVYYAVMSFPQSPSTPSVNIAFSLNKQDQTLNLSHVGGKPLDNNTEVRILINGVAIDPPPSFTEKFADTNPSTWGMGEVRVYDLSADTAGMTEYSVEVMVIDGRSNSIIMSGKNFVTNRPPTIISPAPWNNAYAMPITLSQLNISISDPDDDSFSWTIETSPFIGSASGTGTSRSVKTCDIVVGLTEDTTYRWYVNATDPGGSGRTERKTYTFTTSGPEVDLKDPVDDNSGDVDASPDKGNETGFINCQDNTTDENIMTIQEYDNGIPAVNNVLNVDGFTNTGNAWTKTGSSPYLSADDGANYITTATDGADEYWFTFADTLETGIGFTVAMSVDFDAGDGGDDCKWYIDTTGDNTPEFSGQFNNPTTSVMSTGTIAGFDTASEINAARVWFEHSRLGGAQTITIDHAYLTATRPASSSYCIDFEYNFTDVDYSNPNEQLCMYISSRTGTEDLNIVYWTGSSWSYLGTIAGTGWVNVTATGLTADAYTIRFVGATETGDTEQGSWSIDCIFLHLWN